MIGRYPYNPVDENGEPELWEIDIYEHWICVVAIAAIIYKLHNRK